MDQERAGKSSARAAAAPNRTLRNAIIVVGTILILARWVVVAISILNARTEAIQEAERDATNLSITFAAQIARSLTSIEEAMNFLEADYRIEGKSLDLADWAKRSPTLAGFDSHISIVDPAGNVVATTAPPGAAPANVADREHFRVHLTSRSKDLFVSTPIMGRASKSWTLQITRRVDRPDGSLAAVLTLSIDPEYFIQLNETGNLGRTGVVTLVGLDGAIRARVGPAITPEIADLGTSIVGTPLFERLSAAPSGVTILPWLSDQLDRVLAFRRIPGYPLAVIVGAGLDEELANTNIAAEHTIVLTAAGTVLLAFLVAFLAIEIDRRARRDEELAAERTKLEASNTALAKSRDAAEQASRAKSQFLANMSHELRTPLNAILGFSEVIRDQLMGEDANAYARYASDIHESGAHLLSVIDDILDIAKAEAGRLKLDAEPLDLADLIARCVMIVKPQAERGRIDVSVELAPNLPEIVADPAKLRQILINLLSNAVKFTREGGRIAVAATLAPDGGIELSVADTGIGMSQEQIPTALEPFGQIDSSLSRKYGGTGLGLPLTNQLVTLHGGTLTIESVPERGTKVTARFPPSRTVRAPAETVG
jgi:signal transduction histidine kinase